MNTINSISPHSNSYLQILECVSDAPETLFYTGTLPQERRPTVAIVGSRKPTPYGREVTERLADELARRGVVIISGLAIGIDGIAHRAALDAGGTTIAVLANGLHRIYPAAHRDLGEKIVAQNGAIITEYKQGIEPMKHHFLARNRLVSGLADIIIITEAAARSGTLNTAAHALSQGKDVFVVPGNITSPMSAGCNELLRQGAAPLLSVEDVLETLHFEINESHAPVAPAGNSELETKIIAALQAGTRSGDEILKAIDCSVGEFNTALTMLEISGAIKSLGGNRWRL